MDSKIHIAFRFHGNFYHSYRGDTPDELGFGKDIRIIRFILETLDTYNQRGIPVCGTWDFENYFSLEKIMPEHCPDIIKALQRRVTNGMDEIQFMSYNNGLVNAHTAHEFEAAIRYAQTNLAGSGLFDLFGNAVENMVRPQEMMYTPIHLKLYKAAGIDSISLYYSSIPFNGFSNFLPRLSTRERYNPLTLTYPGITETMTLLPAYNVGDIADHLSLRRWVKAMRREQLAMPAPSDLILLLDQDADDPFWVGFDAPAWLKKRFSTLRGLPGLIESLLDLEYIQFTTPGRYIKDHPPVQSICFGQDTADGSFDGLSSWVEKWSNHRLFTGLERARILDLQTRRLQKKTIDSVQAHLNTAFEARVKALSTTHFGMAAPVMNLTREQKAHDLIEQAVNAAAAAFALTYPQPAQGSFRLVDYIRGETTPIIRYTGHPSRGLIRLPLRQNAPGNINLLSTEGKQIPTAILTSLQGRQIVWVDQFTAEEEKQYQIVHAQPGPGIKMPAVSVRPDSLQNEYLSLQLDRRGQINKFLSNNQEFASGNFLTSGVTYGRKTYTVRDWQEVDSQNLGIIGLKRMRGSIQLPGGFPVIFEREILLAAGLPYLYITMRISYPRTPDQGYSPEKARRLQQPWDESWQEIFPCQINPAVTGLPTQPLRVWKHNYCDHISSYDLDYGRFSKNKQLASANNHITHAWLAVTNSQKGILVAQSADSTSSVAFCPLRTRRFGTQSRVHLNPFGTYWGRQYRYATATTNLGNLLSTTFSAADHIRPVAPSFNGRMQEFSLLVAPYEGDRPPGSICHDAEAFAYPYIVLNDQEVIADPAHRGWDGSGLGEPPAS